MRRFFEYHPVFGYRFIPGIKVRVPHESGGYLLKANEAGFRCDRPFETSKGASKRVLVFGDSFTAGDGVSNGKRFTDELERLLPCVEFYNFGLPGTGPDQHYLVYRELATSLENDLLLICPLVENIRRTAARFRYYNDDAGNRQCFAKPYFQLNSRDELELFHVPPKKEPVDESKLSADDRAHVDRVTRYPILGDLLVKTNLIGLAHKIRNKDPYPEYHRADDPAWRVMQAILSRWIGEHSRPVMVAPLPFYCHVEEMQSAAHYQARFRELCDATGAHLNDPLPGLRAAPMEKRRSYRFKVDVHPTSEGHRAIAEALAPGIARCLGLKDALV